MLAPPELKQVHPLGKSPVINVQVPGVEEPMVIAESGAIVEYLTEYFGKWMIPARYPEGKEGQIGCETEQWLRYRHLMHYAEGSIMPFLVTFLVMSSKSDPCACYPYEAYPLWILKTEYCWMTC